MKKGELNQKVDAKVDETRIALQMLYDELNQGQQKKVLKNEEVAALLERYGVEVNE